MKKDLSRIVERASETETNLHGCLLIGKEVFGATNEDVVRGVTLVQWQTGPAYKSRWSVLRMKSWIEVLSVSRA